MSSSSVWVQLYYKGKDEPVGNPIFIKTASLDPPVIAALVKQLAKEELKKELDHAGLTEIDIYPPESSDDKNKYKSGKQLEEVIAELEKKRTPPTSDDYPLVVVAPDPKQADGKKCFRFGCWFIVEFIPVVLA